MVKHGVMMQGLGLASEGFGYSEGFAYSEVMMSGLGACRVQDSA